MEQKTRKYIYALGTPLAALAVFYGLMSDQEAALWVQLAGSVLLVGEGALAAVHTSGERNDGES